MNPRFCLFSSFFISLVFAPVAFAGQPAQPNPTTTTIFEAEVQLPVEIEDALKDLNALLDTPQPESIPCTNDESPTVQERAMAMALRYPEGSKQRAFWTLLSAPELVELAEK